MTAPPLNALDLHVGAYEGNNPYDFDNSILLRWYPRRVVANAPGARSLLELGLGHGFSTPLFAQSFARHVVLEGSPAVIERFRLSTPDCAADIVETFFEEFDSEERFDVVVMGFVLEHVDDPAQILARFRKFVAPGGRVFVAVPNRASMNRRLGQLAGMLPDLDALSDNDRLLGHKRYYSVESLTGELGKAGYAIERMEGIYLKPLTTSQLVSLDLSPPILDALCKLGVDYPELSCGILAQATAAR